ncbi:MAG: nucleotide sugar dehydrogenase, partial [bacterium]|nr:nucleotide sugar dehydrogenase [bacterium]
ADVTRVEQAARNIAKVIKKGDLVIVESTSPVGTTSSVCRWLNSERPELKLPDQNQDYDISVAYCPERILPGRTVFELVENDRIIGGITPACAKRAEDFYRNFVRGRIFTTDAATAELVKLAENAFRDVNIAFANELSMICDSLDLDIWEAISLANQHPRVNILKPGAGVGGHCIATDPWFLIDAAREDARLLQAARAVNDHKREHITELVRSRISEFERRPVVACLGLAYKPDIDDLRESPALRITLTLAEEQADILVVEPHLPALPSSLADFPNVTLVDLRTAVSSADVVVVLVGHSAFRDLDWGSLSESRIVDAVGIRHEA